MNILLWVLQVALAWFCLSGGAYQIAKIDDLKKGVAAMRALPKGLWTLFGAASILGGLGLLLPGLLHLATALTPAAAAAVAAENLIISAIYIRYGDKAPLSFTVVMTLLGAFIAYGRFVLLPL